MDFKLQQVEVLVNFIFYTSGVNIFHLLMLFLLGHLKEHSLEWVHMESIMLNRIAQTYCKIMLRGLMMVAGFSVRVECRSHAS